VIGCSADACHRSVVEQVQRVEVVDEIPILVNQTSIQGVSLRWRI
jgi:hypothetical protein